MAKKLLAELHLQPALGPLMTPMQGIR